MVVGIVVVAVVVVGLTWNVALSVPFDDSVRVVFCDAAESTEAPPEVVQ